MKKNILVIFIFLAALFLRVYKLGQYPVGFLWDESALGYNAYSILKTGRDEYGKFFPIVFKSFGDYKPGLYVYLTVPSVFLFGLNEFAVRLPSAIFGSLTIVFLYFLLEELRKFKGISVTEASYLSVLAPILLMISPWHLNFSRGAWELNVMILEIILGFFLLFRFLNSEKKSLIFLSAFSFGLTFFTYQSAKLLTPVLLLGFLIFFRKEVKTVGFRLKAEFAAMILVGFFIINLITILGNMGGRLKVMSLFSYPRSEEETNLILEQDYQSQVWWRIFHSSPIFFTRSVLGRYFNYFSPAFLFFKGDWSNARNGVIYQGVIYYLDLIFLLLGFWAIFSRQRSSWENLMIYWLVVAPIPAALTRDSISSVRAFSLVIPLVFFIAVGLNYFFSFFRYFKKTLKFLLFFVLCVSYFFLFVRFLDFYFIHESKSNSQDRLYGYREAVKDLAFLGKGKNKIVFTAKYGQPYIFYLFYTKYDPRKYQEQAKLKESPVGDVGEVEKIDNIEFRKIYWPADRGIENSLFIGDEFDLPLQDITDQRGILFIKEIKFLDGKTAYRIAETE